MPSAFRHVPRLICVLCLAVLLSACAGDAKKKSSPIPKDLQDRRRERMGKLSGEGIVLFGKKGSPGSESGGGSGIGVNSYLWRATLDTVSFMPLASADPFGGVVLTDWYEDASVKGERFKVNAFILGTDLRSNNVKIRLFRQLYDKERGTWADAESAAGAASAIEDRILARAKELKAAEAE
jgi:hypothetical protein